MCGIIGISAFRKGGLREMAAAMNEIQRHRGPDDFGIWEHAGGSLVLAHRRLAIIDLSDAAHQPMRYPEDRIVVVFNGEIYNFMELRRDLAGMGYRFRTQSDTEVIIAAYIHWGEECVEHLNGMFAFALYDKDRDQLFLARDRAGEKPLFYWHSGNVFVFASELKGLMECPLFPRKLDLASMNLFLAYGYVPGERCILEGANKLRSGHTLTFDRKKNRLTTRAYWTLPSPEIEKNVNAYDLVCEMRALLVDSVKLQLMADVPVGILLSGGLDSSLVTAIASQVSAKPVKTFTISFPGEPGHDEAPFAQIVADHFATEHTVLPAEAASVEVLPELARQYDEPLADSSMIPTFLVSRLIREHATVAIGGDGGDELFAGYPHYSWLQHHEKARRYLPGWAREMIAAGASSMMPLGFRGRSYLLGLAGEVENSLAVVNHFFDHRYRRVLFKQFGDFPTDILLRAERYKTDLSSAKKTMLQNATTVDFMTYLADDILVKVDRASMLNSLEVRAPFLDHRLVEFAFRKVPDSLRAFGNERKILPRLLAQELLPPELDVKRKQGFVVPLDRWFKGNWGSFVKSVLLDEGCCFERDIVSGLLATQEGRGGNTQRLFALVMFELWRKYYEVEV